MFYHGISRICISRIVEFFEFLKLSRGRLMLGVVILLVAYLNYTNANPNGCCGPDTDIKPYFLSGIVEARISQPNNRDQDAYINYRKRGGPLGPDLLV